MDIPRFAFDEENVAALVVDNAALGDDVGVNALLHVLRRLAVAQVDLARQNRLRSLIGVVNLQLHWVDAKCVDGVGALRRNYVVTIVDY